MKFDLVIKNGTVVTAETTYQADIGINGRQIAALAQNLAGRQEIDAAGKLVTPGAIDPHVHLQMPIGGYVSADDFFTGTRAAAFGGTTAVVDFVEPQADETMLDALAARQAEAEDKAVIDYGLHMTIGPTEIDKLAQVPDAFEAGCASFKMYMAYGLRLNDGELLQALQAVRAVDGLTVIHAENWDVITTLITQNLAAGRTQPRWHPRSRPAPMEGEAVGRAIDLATLADAPLYVFHVSCGDAVQRIAAAQQRGLPIYAETCPQYLLLDDTLFERPGVRGALPVCAPPIRTKAHQEQLWTALTQNTLNVVSTDHCPFDRTDKAQGLAQNFSKIPGGVSSIEIRFPALYNFGVRTGRFSANRWVEMCCTTPARLFGFSRKGHIAVGYDADLVVFDPAAELAVSPATLHEKADWTLYEGLTITGWPAVTISRGEVIVQDGEFLAEPGRGQFVKRN